MIEGETRIREMQGKPEDIFRQLPEALGEPDCAERDGNRAVVTGSGDRRIDLDIEPLEDIELGSLELPMQRVRFCFRGYAADEIDSIMAHFDTYTLRTGGP